MVKTHYPDPTWSETDRNGHVHTFDGQELPTLKVIIEGHRWCDECGESHEHKVYACVECGAAVEPRTTTTKPEEGKRRKPKSVLVPSVGGGSTYATELLQKMEEQMKSTPFASKRSKGEETIAIRELAIEANRDDRAVSTFNSKGVQEFMPGTPRYTLIVNNGELTIPLTEIEIQVASQAAKRGHKGMLDFADNILRDRGIIE